MIGEPAKHEGEGESFLTIWYSKRWPGGSALQIGVAGHRTM